LLPVSERVDYLLGKTDSRAPVLHRSKTGAQSNLLVGDWASQTPVKGDAMLEIEEKEEESEEKEITTERKEYTTLDRVQTAMLFQRAGRASALRDFLVSELGRGPSFLRLANAFSALYPRDSEEKRLLDAVLLVSRR